MSLQLIGMLDSPYVRRVAVSLELLGLPFVHRPLSVFTTFEQFERVNPVVKAPSLVCEDGQVLMDSTLILLYAERLASPKRLLPEDPSELEHTLRVLGLALAACEKCVQSLYERKLRPADKWHQPWIDRVQKQAIAAFELLERECRARPLAVSAHALDHAGITTAVVWSFAQDTVPELIVATRYPSLAEHTARVEMLREFRAYPAAGPGVPAAN